MSYEKRKARNKSIFEKAAPSLDEASITQPTPKKDPSLKVHLKGFYLRERLDSKQTLSGSMSISIPSIGVKLKGITVFKKKDFWFVKLPNNSDIDETGKRVYFPCFSFIDKDKTQQLIEEIKKEAIEYIKNHVLES